MIDLNKSKNGVERGLALVMVGVVLIYIIYFFQTRW